MRTRTAESRKGIRQQTVRQQLPGRGPGLGPARPEPAPRRLTVLGDDQHRAAPFAAEGEALDEPEHHEEHRGRDADGVVSRQQSDGERSDAHHEQAQDEEFLTADLVAVVAEHEPAHRTGHEPDREGAERQQGPRDRIGRREEDRGQDDRRGDAVEEEVVPLHGRAEHARGDDLDDRAARRRAVRGCGHRISRARRWVAASGGCGRADATQREGSGQQIAGTAFEPLSRPRPFSRLIVRAGEACSRSEDSRPDSSTGRRRR
jgi:hypothetical protein